MATGFLLWITMSTQLSCVFSNQGSRVGCGAVNRLDAMTDTVWCSLQVAWTGPKLAQCWKCRRVTTFEGRELGGLWGCELHCEGIGHGCVARTHGSYKFYGIWFWIDKGRVECVPRRKYSNQCMLQTGLASKTIHEPQSNVARHLGTPVSITNHPDPLLFIFLLSNYRYGTKVLARGLIGTCAQINNHDNYSPLIWVMSISLITFLQPVYLLE